MLILGDRHFSVVRFYLQFLGHLTKWQFIASVMFASFCTSIAFNVQTRGCYGLLRFIKHFLNLNGLPHLAVILVFICQPAIIVFLEQPFSHLLNTAQDIFLTFQFAKSFSFIKYLMDWLSQGAFSLMVLLFFDGECISEIDSKVTWKVDAIELGFLRGEKGRLTNLSGVGHRSMHILESPLTVT